MVMTAHRLSFMRHCEGIVNTVLRGRRQSVMSRELARNDRAYAIIASPEGWCQTLTAQSATVIAHCACVPVP